MNEDSIYSANLKEFSDKYLPDVLLPGGGTVGNPKNLHCGVCGVRIKDIESHKCQECDAELFHDAPDTLSILGYGPPRTDYWKERALKAEQLIKNAFGLITKGNQK